MPLSITCDCGARFDVDDLLAGQEVPCPECTEPVKVSGQAVAPRTSLWALAALVIALVGGLTPVGGVAAIVAGLVAVLIIARRSKQLTGQWIALTAIGLGVFGTAVTGALFFRPEAAPVGNWLRERALAGQFDDSGPLQVSTSKNDVTLDRPNRDWGVMKRGYSYDPSISDLQIEPDDQEKVIQKPRADLLLFNRKRNAYVDVIRDDKNANLGLTDYSTILEVQLNPYQQRFLGGDDGGFFDRRDRFAPGGGQPERGDNPANFDDTGKRIDPIGPHVGREWRAVVKRGGQTWRFVIRAYHKPKKGANQPPEGPIYVIRTYTPLSRAKANEKEMLAILDSVRFPQ